MKVMKIKLFLFIIVSCLSLLTSSFVSKNKMEIKNFSLMNVDGNMVSLSDYPKAKGFIVIFTCNHCPFAKLYPNRLNALNAKYKMLDVPLIAISSTDTIQYDGDTFGKMQEKAKIEKFNFPYLFDGTQEIAKQFKAQKTPHAFVIWKVKGKWRIKYDGAIDDNGMEPEKVEHQYVSDAVDALLNNKVIEIKESKSVGCQINFRK
jgi:peroxiredoxin